MSLAHRHICQCLKHDEAVGDPKSLLDSNAADSPWPPHMLLYLYHYHRGIMNSERARDASSGTHCITESSDDIDAPAPSVCTWETGCLQTGSKTLKVFGRSGDQCNCNIFLSFLALPPDGLSGPTCSALPLSYTLPETLTLAALRASHTRRGPGLEIGHRSEEQNQPSREAPKPQGVLPVKPWVGTVLQAFGLPWLWSSTNSWLIGEKELHWEDLNVFVAVSLYLNVFVLNQGYFFGEVPF